MSCTLDDGQMYLFDVRQPGSGAPAVATDVHHRDLFCHEFYDDVNVLLGFGDGLIKHIDIRQSQSVCVTLAAHSACEMRCVRVPVQEANRVCVCRCVGVSVSLDSLVRASGRQHPH